MIREEDNIETDLKQYWRVWSGFVWLRIDANSVFVTAMNLLET
jgi:hypothetical protein